MTAGRRDDLITIQRATTITDPYGEEIEQWGALGQEWAQVFYGTGNERRVAAAEQGEQSATFLVLSNSTTAAVGVKDRIVAGASNWDIRGISPDSPKRGYIEFTAVRVL
jgi:head-tail adaptor